MQPFDKHELAELFADVPARERHLIDVEYVDWGVLDFLGWTHPSGHLGYVATRVGDEALLRSMCSMLAPWKFTFVRSVPFIVP